MRLIQKIKALGFKNIIIVALVLGVGVYTFKTFNINTTNSKVKEDETIQEQQAEAKAEREKITGIPYYSNQEYYDSFVGMHVDEVISKLETSLFECTKGELGKDKLLIYKDQNDNKVTVTYNVETNTIEKIYLDENFNLY